MITAEIEPDRKLGPVKARLLKDGAELAVAWVLVTEKIRADREIRLTKFGRPMVGARGSANWRRAAIEVLRAARGAEGRS